MTANSKQALQNIPRPPHRQLTKLVFKPSGLRVLYIALENIQEDR